MEGERLNDPVPVGNDGGLSLAEAFANRLNVDAPAFVPNFGFTPEAPTVVPTDNGNSKLDDLTPSPKKLSSPLVAPEASVTNVDSSPVAEDDWEANADEDMEDDEEDDEEDTSAADDLEKAMKPNTKRKKGKPSESVDDADKKEHVNIVFIGHVDAGKSTIGGQLLFLTGMVDKRTLEKYEREAKEKNRESWYLSWALDTNQEERDKGKTVEVGRAFFTTEHKHFTLLDAPGHKGFVPNMICGASQADLAVLVISARKGEFETGFERGGQTREHAMLAKTAGVKHMVVLINKMDDPTVDWSEERFNECRDKLLPYLKKCGFNPKNEISFMPCSGFTGAFLRDIPPEPDCPWYRGPTFIEYIDTLPTLTRQVEGPFRMPIIDKYRDMGTVVLGKVESGCIKKGATLMLMPNRRSVEVLQLWSDDDEVNQIESGENVKIKLKGVEEEEVTAGFLLCDPGAPCSVARVFDAQVAILEHKSIICNGYSAVLHLHAAVEEVTVKAIICLIDKKTNEKSKTRPRFVKQDQVAIMRLECQGGLICMEPFAQFQQLGRFTLRDEGKTVAIGKVLRVIE